MSDVTDEMVDAALDAWDAACEVESCTGDTVMRAALEAVVPPLLERVEAARAQMLRLLRYESDAATVQVDRSDEFAALGVSLQATCDHLPWVILGGMCQCGAFLHLVSDRVSDDG